MITRGGPIIWQLNRIRPNDIPALQAALRAPKLLQPVAMQQRAKVNRLLAPERPINLPWNSNGAPSLIDLPMRQPWVVHELKPPPPTRYKISGVTKDSTGTPLAGCTVDVFRTATDEITGTALSNDNGEYQVEAPTQNAHYAVAYKAGSPDVAGTTRNDVTGV